LRPLQAEGHSCPKAVNDGLVGIAGLGYRPVGTRVKGWTDTSPSGIESEHLAWEIQRLCLSTVALDPGGCEWVRQVLVEKIDVGVAWSGGGPRMSSGCQGAV